MEYKQFLRVFFLVLVGLSLFVQSSSATERRKDQFSKDSGYYVVPIPYSLPGLGEGLLIGGAYNNIADTHSDVIGFLLTGDIEGGGVVSLDNHLISNRLILDVSAQYLTNAAVRNYNQRGMSSLKDDYSVLSLQDNEFYALRLTGTWYERMFEVYGGVITSETNLKEIRDKDGKILQSTTNASNNSSTLYALGLRFDLTDDYQDPRKGIRYQFSRWWDDRNGQQTSKFYQTEHNLTGYVPIGKRSTIALNAFKADATVTRMGETDFATVESQQGLDCSAASLSASEKTQCEQVVNNIIANNTYGSVSSLGGWGRLRSYPDGRYKGSHLLFYGAEFRWNITDEFTPFDIWIAKDVRTTIQMAVFYERGSIEDVRSRVGDVWRESYGIGARIVTASGLVFRADVANGNEGTEISVIIGYPWETF